MTLSHPAFFAIGLTVAVIAALFQPKREWHSWMIYFGLLLVATAAGGPVITLHPARQITVMVDLSPSTRGAALRDRAALLTRIGQLTNNAPARFLAFSDHVEDLPTSGQLQDLPCDQTRYEPPPADAILIFSDGQFELPTTGAPTYPIIDPQLIHPADAAITEMHFDGSSAIATIRNNGQTRELAWSGTTDDKPIRIDTGTLVATSGQATGSSIQAKLNGGDLWPENDSLTLPANPPDHLERWWIGTGSPPDEQGWTSDQPSDLPSDPVQYLSAGMIVLSNVSANDLSATQQQRLDQYVRDLGGTLFIFGGDQAFSSGGYSGTDLDLLSPLASNPPTPTTHWMLLADSSGSMAEPFKGQSRWTNAVAAMLHLLPSLPAKDVVSVGSFARDLSWWVDGEPAEVAAKSAAPPPNVGPNGPTNLEPALAQISRRTDSLPCELLLLTDADTTIHDPQSLAASLKSAKVRVSLLALADVASDNPVVQIVNGTGGHWISSDDPTRWSQSLQQLMQSAAPTHVEHAPVQLRFDSSWNLSARALKLWNRTWKQADALEIASAQSVGETVPLAAQWRVGLGTVAACAFAPTSEETRALTQKLAEPPRDPRLKVTWKCDSKIDVLIDASDSSAYLNGLHLILKIGDEPPSRVPQIGPGEYELELPAVREPALATVELDGRLIDRRAIAGRYSPEFDAIGNDDAALTELAARTGGQVIAPSQHTPINFNWPVRIVRIDSWLAAAGAALLAAGTLASRGPAGR